MAFFAFYRMMKIKKYILAIVVLMFSATAARAWENPGFEWSVGAELNSAYLFRGMNYGGLSFQPEVSVGYGGLSLTAWGNIGATSNQFTEFSPELDITLSYSIVGITLGVNHLYYFDGSNYFDFKGDGTTQTELQLEFDLGEYVPKFPLALGWYTYIAGDDFLPNGERAYSSYIELSVPFSLPLGFYLKPTVGMTPWRSFYTDYEGDFALNNVSLRFGWEFEFGKHCSLDVFAEGMLNTYGITKENLITEVAERYGTQRMNGLIGIGLWIE